MKFLGKKLYKKLRLFYLILFKKGFIYHSFQKHFTNLSLRGNMANIEKSFNNFIRKKEHQYYKQYQKSDNKDKEDLINCGVSSPFQIEEFLNNKTDILNYFKSHKVFYVKRGKKTYFEYDNNFDFELGYYDEGITLRCPYIVDIISNKKILNCLSSYFSSPYKLDSVSCWWSFKNLEKVGVENTRFFHRDIDNFNFIKVFLYLNDVDENSGPNQYLMYSHKKKYEKKISPRIIKDERIEKEKNIFTFTGKSGDAILANTFGIHRGSNPVSKNRLMMVMSFSLYNSSYCPNKPFLKKNELKTNLNFDHLNDYMLSNYIQN